MIANNNDWIDWIWTEEKHYPETLETRVIVMFRDGTCAIQYSDTVGWWYNEEVDANNWYNGGEDYDIVAYRVVN